MSRLIAPLLIALLVISAALGIDIRRQYSAESLGKITIILIILLIGLISVAFFLIFILTIQRFRQNLFGNQGYLSFALPVSTAEHLVSKYVASILWTIIACAAALASFWIVFTLGIPSIERRLGITLLDRLLQELELNTLTWKDMMQAVLVLFSSATEGIFHLYVSISVGHLWQKHSTIGSVLAFVVLSILRSQLFFRLAPVIPLTYSQWSVCLALVISFVYAFFSWLILERSLNLE